LTVSAAQRKLIAEKKREREGDEAEEEEEEDDDEEEGEGQPEKKKAKTGEKEVEEDDDGAFSISSLSFTAFLRADRVLVMVRLRTDAMMEESDDEEAGEAVEEQGSEPNPILYIEGLPAEVTSEILTTLFQQCVYPFLLPSLTVGSPFLFFTDTPASRPSSFSPSPPVRPRTARRRSCSTTRRSRREWRRRRWTGSWWTRMRR
jgi:hypothetical protein